MLRVVLGLLVMALTIGTAGAGEFKPRPPRSEPTKIATAAKPKKAPRRRPVKARAKPKKKMKKQAKKTITKRPMP